MQQAQPNPDKLLPWERVQQVNEITQMQWEAGITLAEIMQETKSYCMWQGMPLPYSDYRRILHGEHIYVGSVLDDYVVVLRCNKFNVGAYLTVFNVSDVQKLRIAAGLGLSMGYTMTDSRRVVPKQMVHCYQQYPTFEGISAMEGDGPVLFVMETEKIHYHFCKGYKDVQVQLPREVKYYWWSMTLTVPVEFNYLDERLYATHMSSYSRWTFQEHRDQLQSVLMQFPKDSILVAPGDGVGVVANIWSGEVVSGDKYFEGGKVKRESFLETLVRGKRRSSTSILILSYVTSLMTEIELQSCQNWSGPVIWIDGHGRSPIPGTEQFSRNCFIRGIRVTQPLVCAEKFEAQEYKLYTENLLALPVICQFERNVAVDYYKKMRPFSEVKVWSKELTCPCVVQTLSEWERALDKGIKNVYFAPLGKILGNSTPVRLRLNNELSGRKIYCIPASHAYSNLIRQLPSYVSGQYLYFYASVGTERSLKYDDFTLNVSFQEYCKEPALVEFVGNRKESWISHTIFGLQEWVVETALEYELATEYLREYADRGWDKKIQRYSLKETNKLQQYVGIVRKESLVTPLTFPHEWYEMNDGKFKCN